MHCQHTKAEAKEKWCSSCKNKTHNTKDCYKQKRKGDHDESWGKKQKGWKNNAKANWR